MRAALMRAHAVPVPTPERIGTSRLQHPRHRADDPSAV